MPTIMHDWEFIDDGKTIEPISVGMVRDDGAEYYAVFADMDVQRVTGHPWLSQNVWIHLPRNGDDLDQNHPDVKSKDVIRAEVEEFILEKASLDDPVHLWAWFSSFDHVCLSQLFGRMLDLPHGIPMFTKDVRQLVDEYNVGRLPAQVSGLHDALADARHVKVMHDYIREVHG